MRKYVFILLSLLFTAEAFASHIVGGEVFYTYLGPGAAANSSKYKISVRLFRDCNVPCGVGVACLPSSIFVGVFVNTPPYQEEGVYSLSLKTTEPISLTTYPVCISSKPSVCYEVKTYTAEITLDNNEAGYIMAYQNCCRAASHNVVDIPNSTLSDVPGAAYTATMPGRAKLPAGNNSSAVFRLKDTSLVCYQSQFTLDFSAVDPDNDSLSYEFTSAYNGGSFESAQDRGPDVPPYKVVTYHIESGFSGVEPLGQNVSINPVTGIISGVSPASVGRYVVNVMVYEWRNGVQIAKHQKDFIMRVEDCAVPLAMLDPVYITCDGFNLSFKNNSPSPNINSYYWDFGVADSTSDSSTSPTPTYVYQDSGTYTVTLITNRGQPCSDTATTIAKVYPGFIPDFTVDGSCILNPYSFKDKTTSKYGKVDKWFWDFGVPENGADTSTLQNPQYRYNSLFTADVQFTVGNSKGCQDTLTKQLTITEGPSVALAFRDTLICVADTLMLNADSGMPGATYSWAPSATIQNITSPRPLVFPSDTTTYIVTINYRGCTGTDSVRVNVIPFVTLNIGADTAICLTDSVQMQTRSNALYFTWSPPEGVSNINIKDPNITPPGNGVYSVVASVGHCNAADDINFKTTPYPVLTAGADTTICYGGTAGLTASTNASQYTWSPVNTLVRFNTLSPSAAPLTTTVYTITASSPASGCPKPVSEEIIITVVPRIPAFAGRDTAIVINQPLQLNATGGTDYTWTPSTGMNDPNIPNPVVILGPQYDTVLYRVNVSIANCSATDDVKVIVFKTQPDIFIPTGFTPNNDTYNDILRAKAVGMKQFNYFRVYNRWGQMLFSTTTDGLGWDGRVSGIMQPSGTYVFTAQAIDYTGKVFNKKGTVVLIR